MAVTQIESVELTSNQSSITFTGIPQTFTHLLLQTSFGLTDDCSLALRINSSTSNYDTGFIDAIGGDILNRSNAVAIIIPAEFGTIFGSCANFLIPDYTTDKKHALDIQVGGRRGSALQGSARHAPGVLRNAVGAVSTITVLNLEGGIQDFVAGSKFKLYGVI